MNQIELLSKLNNLKNYDVDIENDTNNIELFISDGLIQFTCVLDIINNTGYYSIYCDDTGTEWAQRFLDADHETMEYYNEGHFNAVWNGIENAMNEFNRKRSHIHGGTIEQTLKKFSGEVYGYIKNDKFYIDEKISSILYGIVRSLQKHGYEYDDNAVDILLEIDENNIEDYIKEILVLPTFDSDIKAKYDITRTDDEIKSILKTILSKGINNVSAKQLKYALFAQKLYENL